LLLLGGAELAQAQQWPANASYSPTGWGYPQAPAYGYYGAMPNAYPPGYSPSYQPYANNPSLPYAPGMTGAAPNALPAQPGVPIDPQALQGIPAGPVPFCLDDPGDNDDRDHEGSSWHDWFFTKSEKERCWFAVDYMFSWIRPDRVPGPLATTGSTADANPGALGQSGTAVLYPLNNHIDYSMFSGIHGEIGLFLDGGRCLSVDIGGFWLLPNHETFSKSSDSTGNPLIARPIFNIVTDQERAFFTSFPAVAAGGLVIDSRSTLFGGEFNARWHHYPTECCHFDCLFGFRYLHLAERITLQDEVHPLDAMQPLIFQQMPVLPGSTIVDSDRFETINQFYGLQLGSGVHYEHEWFYIGGYAKVGLGATEQSVDISDATSVITPGVPNQTAPGGILALPSNIGHYHRTEFGVVPEVGLNVAVNFTPHIRMTAGYSFLYWNEVARPGSSIDRAVNPSQVPTDFSFGQASTPTRPLFSFSNDPFWVHNFSVGLEFHY
jgi:hypothetical protein